MNERVKQPPTDLIKGMTDEERHNYADAWRNSTHVTDKIKTVLFINRQSLIDALIDNFWPKEVNGFNINDEAECRSDIRSIDCILQYLP